MSQGPRAFGWFRRLNYWLSWYVGRAFFRLYFRMAIHNAPQPFPAGRVVLAANHCSFLDPILLALAVPRRVIFLVTSDMFYLPLLRPLMWLYGCIPVQEDRANTAAVRAALAELKDEQVVGIFPEGAISKDGRLKPGEEGVALLIQQSKAPVIPAAVLGTFAALRREQRFPRPAKLEVKFGPVLDPVSLADGRKRGEAREHLRDCIMREIEGRLPVEQQSESTV